MAAVDLVQPASALRAVDRLMQEGLTRNVFPGAVLLVARGPWVLFHQAYGVTSRDSATPVSCETLFDLASLTKPLATALAILRLVARQYVALEQPVAEILPCFGRGARRKITIEHLLRHTSGLPAYQPYYVATTGMLPAQARWRLRAHLAFEALVSSPGRRMCYSDLGFMLLAWVVEEISKSSIDAFVHQQIYGPLGIAQLGYRCRFAPQLPAGSMAATERCSWRGRLLEGEVHDENAAAVGGSDGHAGLFGTAAAIHRLLVMLRSTRDGNAAQPLCQVQLMRQWLKRDRHSGRALGFDAPAPHGSSSGAFFSAQSVGHLGFTGTSFWWDLPRDLMVVLLTNRIHPTRNNLAIRAFRPCLHDAVMKSVACTQAIH